MGRAHHLGAGVAVLALALTMLPAGAGVAAASSGRAARAAVNPAARAAGLTAAQLAPRDDPTASQDSLRTGWDPNEPGLSPSVVHGASFGQVFRTAVNGQVYAQPLVIGSTVVVATENDWVYGAERHHWHDHVVDLAGNPIHHQDVQQRRPQSRGHVDPGL
jgi:hypothetical protein